MNRHRTISKLLLVVSAAVVLAACGDDPENNQPPVSACAEVSCGVGTCVERDGQAACECPAGHHAEGLSCVSDDLCSPNPCKDANRTVCRVEGEAAVCDCNPGFVLDGAACVPERVSCDGDHEEGDEFEPDECPEQARDIGTGGGQNEAHTIFPAGDADWFTLASEPGRIYEVTAEGDDGFALSVAVYGPQEPGQQGPPQLASQNATSKIALAVKSQSEQLLVRVRASTEGGTGGYTLSIRDAGLDDHGDDAASATLVSPNDGEQTGRWQFGGDKDWLKFDAQANHAYKITCSTSGLANRCAVRLLDADGNVLASDEQVVTILTRRVTADGPLFVELALSNSGMADYTWKVDDLGPDDHGNDAGSATPIAAGDLGTEHAAKWELSGDEDWLRFDVAAGHVYRFTCTGATSVPCQVRRLDAAGSELDKASGSQPVLTWKAAADATEFFVLARPDSNPGTGDYTWKLEDLGLDDHGDDAASATPILASGIEESAKWEFRGDRDWLRFDATEGNVYRLSCSTSGLGNSCAVTLRDAAGAELVSDANPFVLLTWSAPATATFYVELAHATNQPADYTWKLEDLGGDDHGDDLASATLIPATDMDIDHQGSWLISGDRDWLKFDAKQDHVYRFTCASNVAANCVVRLIDASGAEVDSDSATTATVTWKSNTAATWYFEITRPASNPGTGTYTWKLENLGADDHGDDAANATPVVADGTEHAGQWQFPGDRDWLQFDAGARHAYRISCATSGLGNECVLRVRDAAGTVVASQTSAAVLITWEAPAAATYFIELALSNSGTADYTWRIQDLGADDHGNDPANATTVTAADFGTDHAAAWESSGDKDVLKITTELGHIYRLTCTGATSVPCQVRLLDDAGNELDRQSGSTSVALSWRSPIEATYYVELTRPANNPGTGSYTWKVEDLGFDDHGNDMGGATKVEPAQLSGPDIDATWEVGGDKDFMKFEANANDVFRFNCSVNGTGNRCVFRLYDSSGTQIATDNQVGFISLTRKLTAAGTYYMEFSNADSGRTGPYTWKLTWLGNDEYGDSLQDATPITVNASETPAKWNISGDLDFVRFDAPDASNYRFTCVNKTSGATCKVTLRDSAGAQISTNTSGSSVGSTAVLNWKATAGTTYYVEIARGTSGTGDYAWKLEDLGP